MSSKQRLHLIDSIMEYNGEERITRLLEELERLPNDEQEAVSAFESICRKLGIRSWRLNARMWFRRMATVAAVLFLPVAISLAFAIYALTAQTSVQWTEIHVPEFSTQELLLSDGSRLLLNGGTRVTYPDSFSGDEREIFLDGEVYADIAPDSEHPFLINSGAVRVQVLGTKFDFKSYSDAQFVQLMLLEGSVQMEAKFEDHIQNVCMVPGDFIQCDKSKGIIEKKQLNVDDYTCFDSAGSVAFRNVPLSDAVLDLERIFGEKIVILDSVLCSRRVLAFFSNGEDCETILRSICLIDKKIKVEKIYGTYFVSLGN